MLIVLGSLLALLVWIAVAGTSSSQYLKSFVYENAKDAVALSGFKVNSANLALNEDIFCLSAVSENDKHKI